MYVGYVSSSFVETTGFFALSTASICGMAAFNDELVHSTTMSGLQARRALAGSSITRMPSRRVRADEVPEVAADLRRVDVDAADDREPRTSGDLPRDGDTDRAEAVVQHANLFSHEG